MKQKSKNLIWVYPENKYKIPGNKSFIYGYAKPKSKLFLQINDSKPSKIKLFSNGNFAQSFSVQKKENIVKLICKYNGKKISISRKICITKSSAVNAKMLQRNVSTFNPEIFQCNASTLTAPRCTLVIDPGHGGTEHGTHDSQGIPEKFYNLQISKMLYKELKKHKHFNVYITRTNDKYVSLKDRVDFAYKKNADILISIHHNALPDHKNPLKYQGLEVYYLHKQSKSLAQKMLKNISKETGLQARGIIKRDFALTRPRFTKAILIECGYLIHPLEGEYLAKESIQKKIVKGILKAIIS